MHASPSLADHGRTAVRFIKSLRAGEGDRLSSAGYVEASNWSDRATIAAAIKAPITAVSAAGAAALVKPIGQDLAAFVHPLTAVGRLAGLRRVPLNVRLLTGTSAAVAHWRGEGSPAPLSRMDFAGQSLKPLNVSALAVVSNELLLQAGTAAENEVGACLAAAAVTAMDYAFLDPANLGITDVMPRSVAADLTPLTSSGASIANIDSDLAAMVRTLVDAGSTLEFGAWVMSARTATSLALMRGASGAPAFPNINSRGGSLVGLPVVVVGTMPLVGSPASSAIVLLDAQRISYGDAGEGELELAAHASIEMRDDPTNDSSTASATTMVSMFQVNSSAIRVVRYVNWECPLPAAIALTGVAF